MASHLPYSIDELKALIAPIAQQHGVARVALFGSYARDAAGEQSDLDLKIDKGDLRSLFQLSGFKLALEDKLQIPVDIITSEANDRDFLAAIATEEVILYERA